MVSTDAKLAGIVTRFALAISFLVATALPVGYAIKEFGDMSDRMMLRAKAKAASIGRLVTANPELWHFLAGGPSRILCPLSPVLGTRDRGQDHRTRLAQNAPHFAAAHRVSTICGLFDIARPEVRQAQQPPHCFPGYCPQERAPRSLKTSSHSSRVTAPRPMTLARR